MCVCLESMHRSEATHISLSDCYFISRNKVCVCVCVMLMVFDLMDQLMETRVAEHLNTSDPERLQWRPCWL